MRHEENKWLKSISINLHAYAVILNDIGPDKGITYIKTPNLTSTSKLLSLCFKFPHDSITRIQDLFTCLQEDCNGYWEWIADSLHMIPVAKKGVIPHGVVHETIQCLLSYYSTHSYGMDSKRISKFHSLVHYVIVSSCFHYSVSN